MKALHSHYDVVIIGAGMVGSAFASALTFRGSPPQKILLIESSSIGQGSALQPGFDARSTVLSASTVEYFKQLELWNAMAPYASAIDHIQVSDQGHLGGVHMHSSEARVDALGHVVENAAIGRALNAALLQNPMLELLSPVQVTTLSPHECGMQVGYGTAGGSGELTAALVVVAEGGRSGLAQQLGIHINQSSYRQHAVIANVAVSQPHQGVAHERFTPKGPLALLPLTPHGGRHRMALVWTHPEEEVERVLALAELDFLAQLQQQCGQRAGTFLHVGQRACFPLRLQVAEEQYRPSLALLGNIAHTLHPVAGQGFNLALRDTMALAANVRQSLREGVNVGKAARLQQWWSDIAQDQQRTIGFSDKMTRLFSSANTALSLSRKGAMAGLELLPPLKHFFMQQALGFSGPAVRL